MFLAVIAGSDDSARDLAILLEGIGAATVVWFAHVVAYTTARHGLRASDTATLQDALRNAIAHSGGIFIGPTPALVTLALGAANIIDDDVAYFTALGVGMVVLIGLSLLAFVEQKARWYVCLGGTTITTLAGVAAIALKAIF